MAQITTAMVKELREKTGAGVMDCRNVLREAGGDLHRASQLLQAQGLARLEKKSGHVASQGVIESYIHFGGRLGVIVEVNCETDFVAHTSEFKELAHNLALQIAATDPRFINPEDLPQGSELDPEEVCLLAQRFVKDEAKSIKGLIGDTAGKVGEKISIGRFARFELSKEGKVCGKNVGG